MKKGELIKLLESVPDDAEIVVHGYYCEIMGEYAYNENMSINESTACLGKRGDYQATYSNYADGNEVPVWVIE